MFLFVKAAEGVKRAAQGTAAKVEAGISKGLGEENWREFRQLFGKGLYV